MSKGQAVTFETIVDADPLLDKITGALVGAAIADAMGWVTEFMRSPAQLKQRFQVDELKEFVTWGKTTGGRFNAYIDYIQKGEYSDDTQLTLCTARSAKPDGTCDVDYFAKQELPDWLSYARGAGATITAAAKAISRKKVRWNSNYFRTSGRRALDYRQAGANGAAMRISPLVLANPSSFETAEAEILRNAVVTHGHPRALLGAVLIGKALWCVLRDDESLSMRQLLDDLTDTVVHLTDASISQWTEGWVQSWNRGGPAQFSDELAQTKGEVLELLKVLSTSREMPLADMYRQLGCLDRKTKGSGTSTAAAAIGLFLRYGGNFEKLVVSAVNMIGSDTDTIAAMAANLAGARCGYTEIPERWAAQLQDLSYLLHVGNYLHRVATRTSEGRELRFDPSVFGEKNLPGVTQLLKRGQINQGQRVAHELLGPGWVQTANMQAVRRRGGGNMIFAEIVFDMGQKCKFRAHIPSQTKSSV